MRARSRPSLRAISRTDGAAGGALPGALGGGPLLRVGCACGRAVGARPLFWSSGREAAPAPRPDSAITGSPVGVYVSTVSPTCTFVPGLADSVPIVPANGAGTSIVALSDITSASPWPRTTASPGRTSQRTSSTS